MLPRIWKLLLFFLVGCVFLLILVGSPSFRNYVSHKYDALRVYIDDRFLAELREEEPSISDPLLDHYNPELGRTVYDFDRTLDSPTASEFYEFFYSQRMEDSEPEVWKNWNWEDTRILATIVGIAKPEGVLLLSVVYPSESALSSDAIAVAVSCDPSETASFLGENMQYLGTDVNLFDIADAGEDLYTFCMDPLCKSIGKSCVLIESSQ